MSRLLQLTTVALSAPGATVGWPAADCSCCCRRGRLGRYERLSRDRYCSGSVTHFGQLHPSPSGQRGPEVGGDVDQGTRGAPDQGYPQVGLTLTHGRGAASAAGFERGQELPGAYVTTTPRPKRSASSRDTVGCGFEPVRSGVRMLPRQVANHSGMSWSTTTRRHRKLGHIACQAGGRC